MQAEKPTGKYKCLACGKVWDGKQLYLDPSRIAIVWTCGDLFCGGAVKKVESSDGCDG